MKNCRETCRYKEICKNHFPNCSGSEGLSPNDCPIAWKIEDILMDYPFSDEDDGPELEDDEYDDPELEDDEL